MKIKSEHIIIVIVTFLIGIAAATYVISNKNDASPIDGTKTTGTNTETVDGETEANETIGEDAEKTETDTATPTVISNAPKPVTTATPSAQFVTGSCKTGLTARKDEKLNAIILNWSPCASDDFQFYKLVKSSKNTNPNYPADPVVFSSSNSNVANFVDKTVAARTSYYYRLCVVQRLGQLNCSDVASASF